jgi:hypothetical protein
MSDETSGDATPQEPALTPEEISALAAAWRRSNSVRDSRDVYIASCRAVNLPDDAAEIQYGSVWLMVVDRDAALAWCEVEYQKLLRGRPGLLTPDDRVSRWLLERRTAEVPGSAEWWAYDRARRQYLDKVATGEWPTATNRQCTLNRFWRTIVAWLLPSSARNASRRVPTARETPDL